jgi:signal transduction histidine kinase
MIAKRVKNLAAEKKRTVEQHEAVEATTEVILVPATTTQGTSTAQPVADPPPGASPLRVFRSNQLLTGMPEAAFERFSSEIELVHFAPEELIFEEGATGDCVYLIASGSVRISKKGRGGQQETLTYLTEGDFFGELALVDDGRRSAQATAQSDCILGRVNEGGWALLVQIAPAEVLGNFTRSVARRLRFNNQHLIEEVMRNERLSMLGATVSSIVHDMNNPLSSILAACELMRVRSTDPLVERMAGLISDSVHRMDLMTRELVEYSRGTTQLNVRPTSGSELLKGLAHEFEECRAVNIDVHTDVLEDCELRVDGPRMVRVFTNLVRNAREAMQTTGGELRFRLECKDDVVNFEISDNGCGIAPDVLPRIFEPFVTHGKTHGTGLGLAISKSIVDAHGGKIAVESAPNVGTKFLITLPAEPPSLAAA